jgi:hypothetical protein
MYTFRSKAWKRGGGAFLSVVYVATNVLFCHASEVGFWSARQGAARKMVQGSGATADALVLAQLPGGLKFDVQNVTSPKTVAPLGDLPLWLGHVVAPFGNLREIYLSKRDGAPLVIHIQDLHDSVEAQENMAGLVNSLQEERGVRLVGLEGAQGAFAIDAFRAFPDAEITKAVATFFMEEGYLGGPEFAAMTAPSIPLLWGVEDMDAYQANVNAVKESARNRPPLDLFLREAKTLLDEIKSRRLSAALLEYDANYSGYQSRKIPLGTYVRYLFKTSPADAERAPNLVLLRDALRWEESLEFQRLKRERADLLERLVRVLPKAQLERLVNQSALYRSGRVTYGDYYRFFRSLCEEGHVSLKEYGQFNTYVRYVLLAERINRNDLLNELSALERAVQNSLVVTDRERRVVNAGRHLDQLDRLVHHTYTPADWNEHLLHAEDVRSVGLAVRVLAQEEGLPNALSPPSAGTLIPYENFCAQALGRNGALVNNLLKKMDSEKTATAVLVAGGFHTEGITRLLKQKDVSYAVVTPQMKGTLPDGHRTLDLLARDPAPLEKLFAGEPVNIPTPRMGNRDNSNTPLVRGLVTLFAVLLLALQVMKMNLPTHIETSIKNLPGIVSAVGVRTVEGARVTVLDALGNTYGVGTSLAI